MYRCFAEKMKLKLDIIAKLKYEKPEVLQAPYFRDVDEQKKNQKINWEKVEFKYGQKNFASGYKYKRNSIYKRLGLPYLEEID